MTDGEYVVEDVVGRGGWHRVHVLRGGGAVDAERWVARVPEAVPDEQIFLLQTKDEAGMRHLHLWYPAREAVRLCGAGPIDERANQAEGVLWWVGPGQSLRQAAEDAVVAHWFYFGSDPTRVVCRALPKGAGERVEVLGLSLQLAEVSWSPKRFIFVGNGGTDGQSKGVDV